MKTFSISASDLFLIFLPQVKCAVIPTTKEDTIPHPKMIGKIGRIKNKALLKVLPEFKKTSL